MVGLIIACPCEIGSGGADTRDPRPCGTCPIGYRKAEQSKGTKNSDLKSKIIIQKPKEKNKNPK